MDFRRGGVAGLHSYSARRAVPESATLCVASTVTFFAWPTCHVWSLVWSRRWVFQGRHLQQNDATGKCNPVRVPGLADSELACAFYFIFAGAKKKISSVLNGESVPGKGSVD